MTLTREFIDDYEREVDRKYDEEKKSIQAVREFLDRMETDRRQNSPSGLTIAGDGSEFPAFRPSAVRQTLVGKIEEICANYKSEQWTMRRMLDHLRSIGFPLKMRTPETSLSNALSMLAKKGKLHIIRRGKGRMGSVYQWKQAAQQPDEAAPAADNSAEQPESAADPETGAPAKEATGEAAG